MTGYVAADLRRFVQARANHLCEYCLIHEEDTFFGCQVDHVISQKHGGDTTAENLANACTFCNRAKGSDIKSIALMTREFTRFYNPRSDHWADHFALRGVVIESRTAIGEATSTILAFNEAKRILERESLQKVGRYPPDEATQYMKKVGT